MVILMVLGYGLLAAYESIPLYKQKRWRELWVNSCITVCSFGTAILLTFGIKLPSPSKPIEAMVNVLLGRR